MFLPLDIDMAFSKLSFSFVYIVLARVNSLLTGSFFGFLLTSFPIHFIIWNHKTRKPSDEISLTLHEATIAEFSGTPK